MKFKVLKKSLLSTSQIFTEYGNESSKQFQLMKHTALVSLTRSGQASGSS